MIVSLIAAMSENRVIGANNMMPWHMPADLAHFKQLTLGKPIIMGRKTFESIGKPLPGRRNVVISRNQALQLPGCEIFHNLQSALQSLEVVDEAMVIGGAAIFKLALPLATRMYLTLIAQEIPGDTYFPVYDSQQWVQHNEEQHVADQKNPYAYRFLELRRASA